MYSRNRMSAARGAAPEARYGERIPPGYGGNAFRRPPPGGIPVEDARPRPLPLPPPSSAPETAEMRPAPAETRLAPADEAARGLRALAAELGREEVLLTALLLLLSAEGERARDVTMLLLLLLAIQ